MCTPSGTVIPGQVTIRNTYLRHEETYEIATALNIMAVTGDGAPLSGVTFTLERMDPAGESVMSTTTFTTGPEGKMLFDLLSGLITDDEIIDGIMTVIPNETGLEDLKILTSVGGRRETLATFDATEKPELLTYFFSPSYIREAIRLTVAAVNGETYQDQEINGQQFLIPTIEIDKNTVEEYRNSQEYIDRYSI
jgi:hypothetical protein